LKRSIQKLEDYFKSAEKAQTEGKYSFAENIWYAALEESLELPPNDRRRALVKERLCECLWYQKKFDEALPLAKELVGMYCEVLGPEHIDTAGMIANLALLYHVMQDYQNAEPLLNKAHQIKTKHLGEQHPDVRNLTELLNGCREKLGIRKTEPGAPQQVVSGRTWSKTGKFQAAKLPDAPLPRLEPNAIRPFWQSFLNKAKELADQCDWTTSEGELLQALALVDRSGIKDDMLKTTLIALVDVQSRQDKHLLAAANAARLHELTSAQSSQPTQATADSLNNLARLFYYGNDLPSAQKYAEACSKQYEALFGPEDAGVATSLVNLALLYHLQKNYSAAESAYQRALSIRTKKLGAEHPLTNQVLKSYSNLLKETHREEEADHMEACATGMVTGSWKVIDLDPEESLTQ